MSTLHKLTVFIPVYRGGAMFAECLNSLLPHMDCFAHIIVSINKSPLQHEDMAAFARFRRQTPAGVTCTCLKQPIELSAKWHAVVFSRQLRRLRVGTYCMSLAHDDILLPSFSRVYAQIQPLLTPTTVINPARSFFLGEFLPHTWRYDYYGLRDFPQGIATDDIALQTLDGIYVTNISGFIYPYAMRKLFVQTTRYLLFGYRSEYIILTAPGATAVCSTPEPVIGIRLHARQQGRIDKPFARKWDEHVYLIHLYRRTKDPLLREKICFQSRLLRVWKHPRRSLGKLLKKIGRKLFR